MPAGDWVTLISIAVALWFVPRFLWRQYRRNHMSSNAPVRYEVKSIVSPGTVAPEPLSPAQFGPPPNWYANRPEPTIDLALLSEADRDTLIDILSVLKKDGEYLFSANKILELVGGTAADVKARVAALRPKPPAPKPKAHLDRPVNGW